MASVINNSQGGVNGADCDGILGTAEKLIIDTDPGIDDSMAILVAFQTPEVEILGLTSIFGNATTEDATCNALLLCEIAGHQHVPVGEGFVYTFNSSLNV